MKVPIIPQLVRGMFEVSDVVASFLFPLAALRMIAA